MGRKPDRMGDGRKNPSSENGLFQEIDADLGPEDPDEFIGDQQDEEEERDSPKRMN